MHFNMKYINMTPENQKEFIDGFVEEYRNSDEIDIAFVFDKYFDEYFAEDTPNISKLHFELYKLAISTVTENFRALSDIVF